ncbi:MAG: hypothetical protein AB8B69_19525 [Chitinophagales bacterium]
MKNLPKGNYHLEVMDILGQKVLREEMENGIEARRIGGWNVCISDFEGKQ